MPDAYDLQRFVAAQHGIYQEALSEIRRGCKRGHWMWYIFPQFAGLGRSAMAQDYAIRSIDEAKAYISHPVLGPRLYECVGALHDLPDVNAEAVFGAVDGMKLRSSLTLFEAAGGGREIAAAIDRWFDGGRDKSTLRLLKESDRV